MKKIYLLALAFAVLTGVAVYFYAGQLGKKTDVNLVSVVVAKQRIPERTLITQNMLETKKLPAEAVNSLALRSLAGISGKVASVDIETGEQILSSKLADRNGDTSGLANNIPEGKRALTIEMTEITGVAGYVKPGDCVDIVASYMMEAKVQSSNSTKSYPMSMLLAQNIKVLVVGTTPVNQGDGANKQIYKNITVAVTPEESVELTTAQIYGKLSLTLRPKTDTNTQDLKPYTPSQSFWDLDWTQLWVPWTK